MYKKVKFVYRYIEYFLLLKIKNVTPENKKLCLVTYHVDLIFSLV